MAESIEILEARMDALRRDMHQATRVGDRLAAKQARSELREVERAWHAAFDAMDDEPATTEPIPAAPMADPPPPSPGVRRHVGVVPVREQVHQALTVLGASAGPKLISAVQEAFFAKAVITTKLASLRRDEERSFAVQAYARPYYICAALTHDRLTPARGLLAVSTWSMEQRIVGPLGPRVDFLTHAEGVAQQMRRMVDSGRPPSGAGWRLLARFAANIPGAHEGYDTPDPERVIRAAHEEAAVHHDADWEQRQAAAERARARLSDAQQLFGAPTLAGADRRVL